MANNVYQSEYTGQQMDSKFSAVAALQEAVAALETAVAAKYTKPDNGIPATDLDADVQAALALALTAVQSLADYYTKAQVDAIAAAIAAAVNSTSGVTVTTLPSASADTLGKIYYVGPDGNGEYARKVTSYDGTTYSWLDLGTTAIDLTQYATKAELSQLDQKVNGEQTEIISLSESTTSGNSIPATPARELTVALKAGRRYNISWTGLTSLVKKLTFYSRTSTDTAVQSYWNGSESTASSFTAQVASFDIVPIADVYKMRLYSSDSDVVGTGIIGITITNYPEEGIVGQQMKGWILTESFTLTSATRDSDGNVSAASVLWPDGVSGNLTITRNSDGDVTQVVATHSTDSYTLTITRDSSGNATASSLS